MYFIALTANDVQVHLDTRETYSQIELEIPVFVITHKERMMVTPDVMAKMVEKWKEGFHFSMRPIGNEAGSDAINAFCEWISREPFGYSFPTTLHNLVSLPIYDVVDTEKEVR